MKKLLLVSILFCSTINALAQDKEKTTNPTDKGHFIVDGSVYFSTNNSKSEPSEFENENKSFAVGISPKAAYFIMDRLALGLETSFTYSDQESNYGDQESSSNNKSISVGPFLRYYLINGFFGQASIGFGTSKNNSSNGSESTANTFRYQLGLGYAIFLNQHISIEPLLSYQHSKFSSSNSSSESTSNGFTLGAGFSIYL
nr:outer membrane beta-barrel protein [uncultured Psychroserpens sp.]